jgi:hypothetical protein
MLRWVDINRVMKMGTFLNCVCNSERTYIALGLADGRNGVGGLFICIFSGGVISLIPHFPYNFSSILYDHERFVGISHHTCSS